MSTETGVITRETAAKLLMLTPRHIARLVADGWIKKSADDRYTVVGCVQGYIGYLKDESRRNSQATAQSEAQKARAREIDLRIAQRERELIPLTEAMAAMDDVAAVVRAEHQGFAARFTREPALRSRLQKGMDDILERIADAVDRQAGAVKAGGDADPAVAGNVGGRVGEAKPDVPAKRGRPRKT